MFKENSLFGPCARGATGFLVALATACSSTTTHVVANEQPAVTRLRLSRSDAAPLRATFQQEGHSIHGSVEWSTECSFDTTRRTSNARTTTTKSNTGANIGWFIASGVVTAVGAGFMVAAPHQDQRVFCGDGGAPQPGDTCDSVSSAEMKLGATIVGLGLGMTVLTALAAARKPKTTTETLPPDEVTTTLAGSSCGAPAALEGMLIALELPNGGRWSGKLEHGGSFRIDIDPQISLPASEARIFVDDVPPAAAAIVTRGSLLGTLSLAPTTPQHAGRRASR
jgi:hypothetical protein